MDTVMKALVAAARVCVIAVSGHYGYATYQAHVSDSRRVEDARTEALASIEQAKERLDQMAAAEKEKTAERRQKILERREARKAARAEKERRKQADRDRAAAILKDAVVE